MKNILVSLVMALFALTMPSGIAAQDGTIDGSYDTGTGTGGALEDTSTAGTMSVAEDTDEGVPNWMWILPLLIAVPVVWYFMREKKNEGESHGDVRPNYSR